MDAPDRVLVALDGSPLATDALEYALAIFPESGITALNVAVPLDSPMSEGGVLTDEENLEEGERERAEDIVAAAADRAEDLERTVRTVTESGTPAETIVEYASENSVEHIVMGSHGRSDLSRIVLGGVATSVIERWPVPVTVIR